MLNIHNTAANATLGGGGATLAPGSTMSIGTTRVTITKALTEGGFGTVYLAQSLQGTTKYALKLLLCQSREQSQEAQDEIENLYKLQGHSNVVKLVDSAIVPGKYVLPSFPEILSSAFFP